MMTQTQKIRREFINRITTIAKIVGGKVHTKENDVEPRALVELSKTVSFKVEFVTFRNCFVFKGLWPLHLGSKVNRQHPRDEKVTRCSGLWTDEKIANVLKTTFIPWLSSTIEKILNSQEQMRALKEVQEVAMMEIFNGTGIEIKDGQTSVYNAEAPKAKELDVIPQEDATINVAFNTDLETAIKVVMVLFNKETAAK